MPKFIAFMQKHRILLGPLLQLQCVLTIGVLGTKFWQKIAARKRQTVSANNATTKSKTNDFEGSYND
jgi:hypothetical protein